MCVMSLNSVDDKDSIHEALYRLTDHGSTNEDELSKHDTPWSCTVHRLCKYATPGNASSSAILENIRSHTDWTLATLVPVSRVVGLELWNLSQQTWVRPQEIARQHSESQFDMHGNN